MISIEEKMKVFTQYLLNKERNRGKTLIVDAKKKQQELLRQSEENIQQEIKAITDRNQRMMARDINKIIAQGKTKAKKMELEEKNRMFGDFNQTILLKAKEWLTPAAIKEYLIACITTIPELFGEKKTLIVHLNEPDLELVSGLFEELLGDYTVQYRPDCSDAIGGMTVEDSERRIFCDFTIKNLIESQQKLIGMTLNNFMDSKVN